MNSSLIKTSKFLSLVLRHRPQRIGIELDTAGWVPIAELLAAMNASGKPIDHEFLLQVVADDNKQRYAISEDGLRIRANQGHSIAIDLRLPPLRPPELLYHGTVAKFVDSIRARGLLRRRRQHVHLSLDRTTAEAVGGRRGEPIVLVIDAAAMHAAGIEFYQSDNGVWLTDHVPIEFITFP